MEQNQIGSTESAYRTAAEKAPHAYLELNEAHEIMFLNGRLSELFGYGAADIETGISFLDLVSPQEQDRARGDLQSILDGAPIVFAVYTFIARDGMSFQGCFYPQPVIQGETVTGIRGFLYEADRNERLNNLLKREKQRTQDYFELSRNLLLRLDKDGKVMELNKTGCEILECTEAEALGKNWLETFIPPEDRPAIGSLLGKMLDGDIEPFRSLPGRRVLTKKGNVKIINWNNRLMKTRHGDIAGMVSSGEDVTERTRLENELSESEEKYRTLFHEARDGKVIIEAETGSISECNGEFERQTGRTSKQLTGMKIWEVRSADHQDECRKTLAEIRAKGKIDNIYAEYVKPDGAATPVEFSSRIIEIKGNKYIQTISRDISRRLEAEKQLRQSEQQYHNLYNMMVEGVLYGDRERNLVSMNPSAEKILGCTMDDIPTWEAFLERFKPVREDGTPFILEEGPGREAAQARGAAFRSVIGIERPEDGEFRWLDLTAVPEFTGGEPAPFRIFFTFTDITEQRQILHALQESEEKFSRAFHQLPDSVTIVESETGIMLEANESAIRMSGRERHEVVGHNVGELDVWANEKDRDRIVSKLRTNGKVTGEEFEFKRKNGEVLFASLSSESMVLNGVQCDVSIQTDITERKKAEAALQESEEKFAAVFRSSPDCISILSGDHRYIDANPAFYNTLGYAPDEIKGKKPVELDLWADMHERKRFLTRLESKGRIKNEEIRFCTRSGEVRTLLFSVQPITLKFEKCYLAVGTDITERKKAEKALADEASRRRILMEQSKDGIVILDHEGGVYEANHRFAEMLGYTLEEARELHVWDWDAQIAPDTLQGMIDSVDEAGDHFETIHKRKDGSFLDVEISTNGAVFDDHKLIFCVCRDITERKKAEQALRESEEKFSTAFYISPDPVIIVRLSDGVIIDANHQTSVLSGYSREELVGKIYSEIGFGITGETSAGILAGILKNGEVSHEIHPIRVKSGDTRSFIISAKQTSVRGEPCLLTVLTDITEQQQTELALRESEERFSKAFHSSPDAMAINTVEGEYLEVNEAFLEFSGYERKEIIGHTIFEFDTWEDKEHLQDVTERLFRGEKIRSEECRLKNKNGELKTALLSLEDITVSGLACRISIITDITDRKLAEQSLKDSEEKFAVAFHSSPDALIITSPDGVYLDINDAYARLYGYSREEKIGTRQTLDAFVYPEQRQEIQRIMEKQGYVENYECQVRSREGKVNSVLLSIQPITLSGETCFLGLNHDITERKLAEQALRESEEKFSTAFRATPDAVMITDENGVYIDVNVTFTRILGRKREEIIGRRETEFEVFTDPAQREEVFRILFSAGGVSNYECDFRYADGSLHTVLFSVKPITLAGKPCYLGISHDITERKMAEEAVRESEERFSIAFHSSPDMAIIARISDTTYYEVNESFCKSTGYSREELIGHTAEEINLWVNPEDIAAFQDEMGKTGRINSREFQFRMKDGRVRTWLCSAQFITLHGETCMLAVASDITERKQAEEQLKLLYEQEAALREKMEEEMKRRAEFTRALVHELKTPLTPIVASSDSLAEILTEEPMKSMAVNLNRGALNLNKRIDELLELARSELNVLRIRTSVIDLGALMKEIVSEMEPMAGNYKQNLFMETPDSLPPVKADPDRIRQVISNLLTNALKFTQPGGDVTLRARQEEDSVIVEVQDTGPGLSKGELERLFQPYYRKESDREHLSGLGLGLALCKTLIDLHGGKIWVESKAGEGCKFSFSLPIAHPETK